MKLTLHHINLSTEKVEEMDAFYSDVMGLDRVSLIALRPNVKD